MLTQLNQWQALIDHQQSIAGEHMRHWFEKDGERFARFHLKNGEILLDYSRNRITDQTLSLLCELAEACHLQEKIEDLFTGKAVNNTENRPALHTALRDNKNPEITACLKKMRAFVDSIHAEIWTGATGKPIKSIVNIGIGGSHLGPKMCTHALKPFAKSNLDIHFISSVDEDQLNTVLQKIQLESTLFIISSKSFTTIEPLTNARSLLEMIKSKLGDKAIEKHFLAVTANADKAMEFGIPSANIFPLWDWVGGRYSIWSAIGLPLMLMIGSEQFDKFLAGAHEMDTHFRTSKFSQNMPVLMGLLGIWNINFLGATAHAIAPYANRLRYLIPYLQQAEMESNGKCMDKNGQLISYASGSIVFGEEGCDSQHSYLQLLHQGTHLVPVDFILSANAGAKCDRLHQDILIASCLSQAQALMRGKTLEEAGTLAPHKMVPGNKPSNILLLDRINPHNLGALIALYEHKIFVQSVIWNINAFDQWGVELGKQLLPDILDQVQHDKASTDSATTGLIQHLVKIRGKK